MGQYSLGVDRQTEKARQPARCSRCRRAQSDRACRRVGLDVTDAEMPAHDAQFAGDTRALAIELHARLPARIFDDFDVRPRDPAAPSSAEDFQHRLFRRESASEMFEVSLWVLLTVLLLRRREDTIEEALPVLVDEVLHPRGLNNVDAMTQDRHAGDYTKAPYGFSSA